MATGAVTHLVEDAAGDVAKRWGKDWLLSTESLLKESKAGKYLAEYLKNTFEPDVAKRTMLRRQSGDAPIDAMRIAHKEATEAHFGKRKEGIVAAVKQMYDEKGHVYANSVADALDVYHHDTVGGWRQQKIAKTKGAPKLHDYANIRSSSKFEEASGMEKLGRRVSPYTFTSNIAIPHMSQPANFLLAGASFKNILQGFGEAFLGDRDVAKMKVVLSGAMEHEFLYKSMEAQSGGWKYFNKVFKSPGFNWIRQRQIEFAAITGKYAAKDAAYEFVKTGSKRAEAELKLLGLDPQKMAAQGGHLVDEDIDKAMYRFASETMFIRSELQTPFKWHQGTLSRLGTMYKDFGFREGKLVKDAISRSAASGPLELMKTMATLAVLFPAVGEFTKTVEHLASGQDLSNMDSPKITGNPQLDGYIDALGYSAGLGVAYSLVRAAKRRGLETFLPFGGPLAGTVSDIGNDLAAGNFEGIARDFLRRASWPGRIIANNALPTQTQLRKAKQQTHYVPRTNHKRHSGYTGNSQKWGF